MKYQVYSIVSAALLSLSTAGFAADPTTQPAASAQDVTVKTAAPVVRDALPYSTQWRIKFDDRTDSAGEITFRFVMKDKLPTNFKVGVAKGLSEKDVAKLVENALLQHGPKGLSAEREDGEDIVVKYKSGFNLTVLANTVIDLDVDLVQE